MSNGSASNLLPRCEKSNELPEFAGDIKGDVEGLVSMEDVISPCILGAVLGRLPLF